MLEKIKNNLKYAIWPQQCLFKWSKVSFTNTNMFIIFILLHKMHILFLLQKLELYNFFIIKNVFILIGTKRKIIIID